MKCPNRKGAADLLIAVAVITVTAGLLLQLQLSSSMRIKAKTAPFNSLAGMYNSEIGVVYAYVRVFLNKNNPTGTPGKLGFPITINPVLPPRS